MKKTVTVPTSLRAYVSIFGLRPSMRRRIYETLQCWSATCETLEDYLNMKHQTCSARLNELANADLIEVVGIERTSSGREAYVWKAK